jgi:acyl-[acyl-carrier-protein] desaturase
MDPTIVTILESFCAVELYLPDYVAKALPMIRKNRAWSWIHINWGYEESKHSLAMEDWLLRSGARTEEQMMDMQDRLFEHEWNLPEDSASGMLIYAMTQELATWVNYRKLLEHVRLVGDPALERLLEYIAVDECAHHAFYYKVVSLFLKLDRAGTIEHLRRVLQNFRMPAVHMLTESAQREAAVRNLKIFDEEIFATEVYFPILNKLGISRAEMRGPRPKKSAPIPLAERAS